ncbi:MAG: adenosylmethionine decarboxylase [Hyphomicrobiaceae bacterium]
MALNDALFQLGMDLDPSTTQTEDHDMLAAVANDDRRDYFCERDGIQFAGTHLIVDLIGASRLSDIPHIEETLKACVEASGATLLHLHHFTPNGGVSGVAVLAESHISIHSWPEVDFAALDIFMCGGAEPEKAVPILQAAFSPRRTVVKELLRGRELWCAGSTRQSMTAGASA